MKRIITFFFVFVGSFSAYSQSYIQDGDRCFETGDYDCAITHYNNAFKNNTGRDKQIAEIKLTRAKWCAEHIKTANQSFADKNYLIAKEEYKKVLDSNPNDGYALSQIIKCDNALNPVKLRKATTADLVDIWNNKYGIQPKRRENLINAGIDPDDAQKRINNGEGKPPEKKKQETVLNVSSSNLFFSWDGASVQRIEVYTNASSYAVPLGYIPSWCNVKTYNGYFTVTVVMNLNNTSRIDWFMVKADGKELRINVEQFGRTNPNSSQSKIPKKQNTKSNTKRWRNIPKTHDNWGLTMGYTQQTIDNNAMEAVQFGLKAEPLFRNGFGINTGINLLGYSKNLFNSQLFENSFDAYAVNIPLHLEYRLNFSKWFNIFAYSGVGLNAITNPGFSSIALPSTFESGGGFRISHIQFNVGRSVYLGSLRDLHNLGKYRATYQKFNFSVSYMF